MPPVRRLRFGQICCLDNLGFPFREIRNPNL